MTGRTPLMRLGIVLLLLAVFVCLSLGAAGGMDDGMGHTILLCCFALAVVIGARSIRGPGGALLARPSSAGHAPGLTQGGQPLARPPDLSFLGILLI